MPCATLKDARAALDWYKCFIALSHDPSIRCNEFNLIFIDLFKPIQVAIATTLSYCTVRGPLRATQYYTQALRVSTSGALNTAH